MENFWKQTAKYHYEEAKNNSEYVKYQNEVLTRYRIGLAIVALLSVIYLATTIIK